MSRLIAVITVSAILATSSLLALNIQAAEATHDSHATVRSFGPLTGKFDCFVGQIGKHQVDGSFEATTNPNLFPPGFGRVTLFATSGGFPLISDRIDNAPSISSSKFTIMGTLDPGSPFCGTPIPSGTSFDYRITGEPCISGTTTNGVVTVTSPGNNNKIVGNGTFTATVDCHLAAAAPNQVPRANAGSDQTVIEGSIVTLDGSGSTDPDRDTLTYSWVQTGGTPVRLSSISAVNPTFTAPSISTAQEILTFELTVNDGKGGTSKDSVSIVVEDDVPIASLTANPTTIDEGQSSELDARGSLSGVGISTYEFTQIAGTSGTITEHDTNPALATFTAPQVVADEIATIQVTVTDRDGDSSTATADIAVRNLNSAPIAENQAVATDEDTALDIRLVATDSDGDALKYTITMNPSHGTLSGTAPDITYNPEANFNGEDKFTFRANDGTADSNTATVSITIGPVNDKPTVDTLTADPTTINEGGGISHLAASATDPDDDPLTYSWSQTSGTAGVITVDSTDSSKATFEAPSVDADETATIKVTVNDGSEDEDDTETAEKTVDVAIKNVNQAPLAKLTADPSTINEGETSRLDASESSDPDVGDSLTYSFRILDDGPGTIREPPDTSEPTAIYEAPSNVDSEETVTVEVTVEDENGGTDTESAKIVIRDIVVEEPPSTEFTIEGFYAPVDMEDSNGNPVINTIRGGQSVPLKFEVFDQNNQEQTSTDVVESFTPKKLDNCDNRNPTEDPIETTNTGGTSLRYDADGGGTFVQNWKTPTGQTGSCYSATITVIDGSSITAYFKLR